MLLVDEAAMLVPAESLRDLKSRIVQALIPAAEVLSRLAQGRTGEA